MNPHFPRPLQALQVFGGSGCFLAPVSARLEAAIRALTCSMHPFQLPQHQGWGYKVMPGCLKLREAAGSSCGAVCVSQVEKKIALLLGEMLQEYHPSVKLERQTALHVASAGVFAGVCTTVAAAAAAVSAQSPTFPASIPSFVPGAPWPCSGLRFWPCPSSSSAHSCTTNSSLLSKGLGRCWASVRKV